MPTVIGAPTGFTRGAGPGTLTQAMTFAIPAGTWASCTVVLTGTATLGGGAEGSLSTATGGVIFDVANPALLPLAVVSSKTADTGMLADINAAAGGTLNATYAIPIGNQCQVTKIELVLVAASTPPPTPPTPPPAGGPADGGDPDSTEPPGATYHDPGAGLSDNCDWTSPYQFRSPQEDGFYRGLAFSYDDKYYLTGFGGGCIVFDRITGGVALSGLNVSAVANYYPQRGGVAGVLFNGPQEQDIMSDPVNFTNVDRRVFWFARRETAPSDSAPFAVIGGSTYNPVLRKPWAKRIITKPFDGKGLARGDVKRAVRLTVFGEDTTPVDASIYQTTPLAARLKMHSDTGYSEAYDVRPFRLADFNDHDTFARQFPPGMLFQQGFSLAMRGRLLWAEIEFFVDCVLVRDIRLEYVRLGG